MINGIYTLANDTVYDQLVALLNSIEKNVGEKLPVCVIAYDDQLEKVEAEVKRRQNVSLLNDKDIFRPWEEFSLQAWQHHPYALKNWEAKGIKGVNRIGMNRRYCAFDERSPFDNFIYFDADVLVLNSLDSIFQQLDHHDVVVYDFQYKQPSFIYSVNSPKLPQVFSKDRLEKEIFCGGSFASHKGLIDSSKRSLLIKQLDNGEAEILFPIAPNQSLLNYMVMRTGLSVYNLALNLPPSQVAGNTVTSDHFIMQENILYDKGVRLTYLHYIGISSKLFTRICQGENLDFPYREIFLHYRYLNQIEERPKFQGIPVPYKQPPNLITKILKKFGFK